MTNPLTPVDPSAPGELHRHRRDQRHDLLLRGARDHRRRRVRQLARRAGHAARRVVRGRQRRHARELPARRHRLERRLRAPACARSPPPAASTTAARSASRSPPPAPRRSTSTSSARGYYGGAGARLFSSIHDVPVSTQPGCTSTREPRPARLLELVGQPDDHDDGHVAVRRLPDPRHAPRHRRRHARPARRARRRAPRRAVLYGVPDTTYQAYNNYGGKSLYDHNSTGVDDGRAAAPAPSRSRSTARTSSSTTSSRTTGTRAPTTRPSPGSSASGYDVSYNAVSDLERSGATVRDHRAFISGAHDEYYSAAMRTALEQARDAGTDLFFTGSNEVYWKVRFEPSHRRPPGPRPGLLQDHPEPAARTRAASPPARGATRRARTSPRTR